MTDAAAGTSRRTRALISIEPTFGSFLVILGAVTALRIIGLWLAGTDLDLDEAQYWTWSRELAWGYFSKPPLIAVLNAASGALCGDSIACIRLPAPLLYFGTSLAVYAAARELYDRPTAFWSGITAALAIGISFSARLMTTDVLLLFFTATALFAIARLIRGGGAASAVALGISFGLGLLSKYAMAYLIPGLVLAGILDRGQARALLRNPRLWWGLAIGVAIFAPNVIWNILHDWPSARSVATNVAPGDGLHPGEAIGFIASQFGVAGPVTFGVLLWLYARLPSARLQGTDRMLLGLTIPPFAVVTANALGGEYNANWAAIAFIPAFVVTSAVLVRERRRALLWISALVGVFAQLVLVSADAFADRVTIPLLARGDIYRRVLGWEELGKRVAATADTAGAVSIVASNYGDVAVLRYYLRNDPRPVYAFPPVGFPSDHFQMTRPLPREAPQPILAILHCADPQLERDFGSVERLGEIRVSSGPTSTRSYFAFRLASPTGISRLPEKC